MIWESGPWKDLLLSDARLLERWSVKTTVTERRSVLIERKIFLAAYSIRKLYEGSKLSTNFRDYSIRCRTYSATARTTTHLGLRLESLYDFDNPEEKVIAVPNLLDIIIHSFVSASS